MTVTERECELCKDGILSMLNANTQTSAALTETIRAEAKAQIESLRREIVLAVSVSTTLIGVFMSVLALILGR